MPTNREQQLRNVKLRRIVKECTKERITLDELRRYWQDEYVPTSSQLEDGRKAARRSKNARAAVLTRHTRNFDFLQGDVESTEHPDMELFNHATPAVTVLEPEDDYVS